MLLFSAILFIFGFMAKFSIRNTDWKASILSGLSIALPWLIGGLVGYYGVPWIAIKSNDFGFTSLSQFLSNEIGVGLIFITIMILLYIFLNNILKKYLNNKYKK